MSGGDGIRLNERYSVKKEECMSNYEQVIVLPEMPLLQAIKRMDEVHCKLLLVMEGEFFKGLISIGDAQRAIIQNVPMATPVSEVMRTEIVVCKEGDTDAFVQSEMVRCRAIFMPVLTQERKISRVVFWDDVFQPLDKCVKKEPLNLPVVVMAGGVGSRLKPLTNILPKPLLPIGEKTILENIMDHFVAAGCNEFYLSLNYKASMIEHYFKGLNNPQYHIHYFREDKPLGTGGSLSLIRKKLETSFFVTNCDNLQSQDLGDIVSYHRGNKNEMTVVAALKSVKLAYGNLITGENELVQRVEEKPEFLFRVNTGVYLLEPQVLNEIPDNTFFQMTDLMTQIVVRGGRVGCFPITDGSWCDIGNWEDYTKALGR